MMANEIRVQSALSITNGNLRVATQPTSFTASMASQKAASPGSVVAAVLGTDVDLSALSNPSMCRLVNLDPTNYVTVGVRDVGASKFYPMLELLPGEFYVVRLTRLLGHELGTGTGTVSGTVKLHVMGNLAPCNMSVEAYEP